ncbi:hypothetical protein DOK67_0002236 [Enterococcus sp. DIV0212c]|uniref:hypothetical protein n=1 Tax=Enterococcus sp. DIV0212c TaxID=2230867 RepID=UPI001A9C1C92|nr:hypothetical protein [Enterococcus sp. DIV0212c]MBO1354105.1 hypothetical protein [Enterococcus sp. DIV0212c]
MERHDEKEKIYQLLHELIAERREITQQYYALKERLDFLNNEKGTGIQPEPISRASPISAHGISKKDIEHQKYVLSLKTKHSIPYDKISRKISSILKEAGTPLNTKQIYCTLTKDSLFAVTYKNLSNNILPRAIRDNSINVEKAYRGFYQYRQK